VPGFDVTIGNYTLVPNPFWGGVLFPTVVIGTLALWPWLERKVSGDHDFHNLLERPRDNPSRTAIGLALMTWVFLVFLSGSADRVNVLFGLDYAQQIWAYRVIVWVVPVIVFFVTKRVCRELLEGEAFAHVREAAEESDD
jgi:ubiquinol-cytochrome c reductase cytochrome b subunit